MVSPSETNADLLEHVLVPVADADDATATAAALAPYAPGRVTTLHVVEKADGVPDKTPVEQSEQLAEEAFAAVRRVFPDADDHVTYATDVVDAIFDTAAEVDASAVAYRSRGGNRILQFLTGDQSLRLVTEGTVPVVALPRTPDDDSTDGDGGDDPADDDSETAASDTDGGGDG